VDGLDCGDIAMSDDPLSLSKVSAGRPAELNYEAFYAAVTETEHGRWFLAEYARRNRHADTSMILSAVGRIEAAIRGEEVSPDSSQLRLNLLDMAELIARTEAELAATKPEASPGSNGGEAQAGARAKLLAATERVLDVVWTLREGDADGALCDALHTAASEIHAVAELQDYSALRAHKALQVLRHLQERIHALIDGWSDEQAAAAPAAASDAAEIDREPADVAASTQPRCEAVAHTAPELEPPTEYEPAADEPFELGLDPRWPVDLVEENDSSEATESEIDTEAESAFEAEIRTDAPEPETTAHPADKGTTAAVSTSDISAPAGETSSEAHSEIPAAAPAVFDAASETVSADGAGDDSAFAESASEEPAISESESATFEPAASTSTFHPYAEPTVVAGPIVFAGPQSPIYVVYQAPDIEQADVAVARLKSVESQVEQPIAAEAQDAELAATDSAAAPTNAEAPIEAVDLLLQQDVSIESECASEPPAGQVAPDQEIAPAGIEGPPESESIPATAEASVAVDWTDLPDRTDDSYEPESPHATQPTAAEDIEFLLEPLPDDAAPPASAVLSAAEAPLSDVAPPLPAPVASLPEADEDPAELFEAQQQTQFISGPIAHGPHEPQSEIATAEAAPVLAPALAPTPMAPRPVLTPHFTPHDPLAAVRALSDDDLIALFS
jgi:hypothetical protein